MLSHFGLKCLFTYFIFQAPEYWDILWSKDRAQHCLWFTEDPVRYHTRHLPAQGLCYYHSKKHLKEAGKRYSEIQEYMVPAPKNSFIVGFAAAKDFSIHKPCAWLSPAIYITENLPTHCTHSLSLSHIQELFINTH